MKLRILSIILAVSTLSCEDQGTISPQEAFANLFQVHLQSGFSNTAVSISLDQGQVYSNIVSTNPVLSLAAVVPLRVTRGAHKLTVTVDGIVSRDATFTVSDTMFALVRYNPTNRAIDIGFTKTKFLYE